MAGSNFPITNYPNGFNSAVTVLGQPLLSVQSNNAFWVDSVNGNDGWKGTFMHPFATVARATAFTLAGDTVMVCAGHTETWSTATVMAMTVANVRVIGMGVGQSRPTFTLDTIAGTTVSVSAAGVTFVNCRFISGVSALTSFFTLTTAKSFTLDTCVFGKTSTNYATYVVDTSTVDNDQDGLTIVGCEWRDSSTSAVSFVKGDATIDSCRFNSNFVFLGIANDTSAGFAMATGKLLTNFLADNNRMIRLNTTTSGGGILVNSDQTTHTGYICNNLGDTRIAGTPLWTLVNSGFSFSQSFLSGVADKSGYILPAADS